jgi:hypothetical protein
LEACLVSNVLQAVVDLAAAGRAVAAATEVTWCMKQPCTLEVLLRKARVYHHIFNQTAGARHMAASGSLCSAEQCLCSRLLLLLLLQVWPLDGQGAARLRGVGAAGLA